VEVVDYACTCGSCFSTCDIQSDTMDAMMPEAGMNVSTNENVRFVDTTAGMTAGIDRPYDGISAGDQTEAMDLVKFLSRPVRIAKIHLE
jgi:hypothetical protein